MIAWRIIIYLNPIELLWLYTYIIQTTYYYHR